MKSIQVQVQDSLREKALQKAKKDGFSLQAILKIFLLEYTKGTLSIGIREEKASEDLFLKDLEGALADAEKGKNLSKPLKNKKEVLDYLDALA